MDKFISFKPIDSKVKTIGRTCLDENQVRWLGLSGSGIEFLVLDNSFSIELVADSMYKSEPHRARFAIYIDDKLYVDQVMNVPKLTFTHTNNKTSMSVRIIKVSECAQSTIGISSIDVVESGDIIPSTPKGKLIEFIGDSITCGYGVDVEDPIGKFSTSSEDFRKSFAYLTATALDCDYSMVSYSGYGIISGYTESDTPHPDILPPIYNKVGWSLGFKDNFSISNISWNFNEQPDLIVINLGTNDATYIKDNQDREHRFTLSYVDFLKVVRQHNPKAPIICTLGIMGDKLFPAISKAVELYRAETLDENISTFKFDVQMEEDGYSIGWHPTFATYQKASNKLLDYIQKNIKF